MMEELGAYRIVRLIGEGGMGKVWEAEEKLSGRRVALKVLHPELARSGEGRKLFQNEMQILARLEHPNIVRSLACIEEAGELAMVLELLSGRTLRSLLGQRDRLPWGEAVSIASQIAAALAAAHGQRPPIIHRDLKPENIMVQDGGGTETGALRAGTVKVMDFGIAKVLEALHQTNTQSVGTLQYMSPEQIDARSIDHRADLYCLGLVLYELLSGRPPFRSASPRELLNLQCTAEPPPLPDEVRVGLPRGVEQLLFELLEKAPEDRPYLAEDVIERLAPFEPAARGAEARGAASSDKRGGEGRASSEGRDARDARPSSSTGHAEPEPSASKSEPRRASSGTEPGRERPTPMRAADKTLADEPRAASSGERRSSAGPTGTGAERHGRHDTIELLDKVDRPREVSTRLAVGLIVGLSLAAGAAAYLVRSTTDAPRPASSATARALGGSR
jgi:serine/threonine protein kinase